MTISTQVYKDTYIADGIEDTFAFSFPVLDEDHILVQVVNSSGTLQVQTPGVHYTVTGTGNSDNRTNYTSGSVVFVAAYIPEDEETVIIKRSIPLTQEVLYVENDTFPAKTHEEALDKLTLITQQLQEQIDRRFGTDYTGEDSTDFSLPAPVANEYIRFNSTATGLESITLNSVTGIDNVSDDPSPDLGGNLDVNGNQIISNSNGDITVQPHGTGKINLLADSITIESEISHYGDTNNRIIFGTDTQDFRTGGSTRIDISDLGVRLGNANARVTTILDEDDMASNSDTALASQASIKAYTDNTAVLKATPVLGGNLDVASYDIVTTASNLPIELDPNGSGNINNKVASGGSFTVTQDGSTVLDITSLGTRLGGANARVTTILDEDSMSSNSATALATQQSIKAYVDSTLPVQIAATIDSAGTLTLSKSVNGSLSFVSKVLVSGTTYDFTYAISFNTAASTAIYYCNLWALNATNTIEVNKLRMSNSNDTPLTSVTTTGARFVLRLDTTTDFPTEIQVLIFK